MPRRSVEFHAGEFYHVYNRGVDRQPIFFDRDNYLFFLKKLREFVVGELTTNPPSSPAAPSSRAADIVAYCLMPNHYHLLIKLNDGAFAKHMQSFAQAYTNAVNKRQNRVGPLFQGRFKAIHVDREEYLVHLSRYIHLNPVEARLVARPESWEFSSYLDYVGIRYGSLPQTDAILSQFDSRRAYRDFVQSGIGSRDPTIECLKFADDDGN